MPKTPKIPTPKPTGLDIPLSDQEARDLASIESVADGARQAIEIAMSKLGDMTTRRAKWWRDAFVARGLAPDVRSHTHEVIGRPGAFITVKADKGGE